MKTCNKCGKTKPLTDFYKASGRDGYRSSCIECMKAYGKAHPERKKKYYYSHREQILEAERNRYKNKREHVIEIVMKYRKSEIGKKVRNDRARRKYADYKEKIAARGKVLEAIEHGKLKRQPCMICGELKVEAHHPDYNKPLEVEWYCSYHHRVIENRSIKPE